MPIDELYVKQLEDLIVDTLLPVYANYQAKLGSTERYSGIDPKLIERLKRTKKVAVLLRPRKN